MPGISAHEECTPRSVTFLLEEFYFRTAKSDNTLSTARNRVSRGGIRSAAVQRGGDTENTEESAEGTERLVVLRNAGLTGRADSYSLALVLGGRHKVPRSEAKRHGCRFPLFTCPL